MSSDKKFTDETIRLMNSYRSKHQAGTLKHNSDLSKIAQRWAEDLVRTNCLSHSSSTYKGEPLGENCAMRWSSDGRVVTANDIIDSWYSEVKDYNFQSGPSGGKKTGHFTQVVWKGSREVGVGKAISRDGLTCMVVANYYPAGNYSGQYIENVKPPSDGKIVLPAKQSDDTRVTRTVTPVKSDTRSTGCFACLCCRKSTTKSETSVTTTQHHSGTSAGSTTFAGQSRLQTSSNWDEPSFGGSSFSHSSNTSGTTAVRREIRQETVGSGANAVVKTITTETVVGPDGRSKTVKTESIETGSGRKW